MAMFGSRPEEPTEWAGLPAEPLEEDDFAVLPPRAVTVGSDALFGVAPGASIAISLGGDAADAADAARTAQAEADGQQPDA